MSKAWDMRDALDQFFEAHREYEFQLANYRKSDAAIGEPEWTLMFDASEKRNAAFRELMRHGLGMRED